MKFSVRIVVLLSLFAFLLTACEKVDTGIEGKVLLASCQGEQIATDCVGQSTYSSTLTIYNASLSKIKSVKTLGDGTFIIALKPGIYFIHPENNGKFPMAADFKVVVTKGELVKLTIYYDTGLR